MLRFVDVSSGDIIYQVGLPKAVYCLKIVQARLLVTAGQGNKISLWDTEKLRKSREKTKDGNLGEVESYPIMQLDLLREMYGPVGCSTYALEVISIDISWKEPSKSCGSDRIPQAAQSSINLLVTGGRAKTIGLWDLETGENILSIPTPREVVIHSLAYHLLEQTFQTSSYKKRTSHLTVEKLEMGCTQKSHSESAISLIRIFAGADNGSIFCWDIVCNTSRDAVKNPIISLTHEILARTIVHSEIDSRSGRSHVSNDIKLDGYQGAYHGHQNIVSTLLLLTPPATGFTEANEPRQDHHRISSYRRPILVSTSKDNSDVRLWHADFAFSPRVHSNETRSEKSSLICQLKNGHTRAIKTLGTALHPQQQSQMFRGMNVFVESSINDIDVIRKRGEIFYDLLTCGTDNKVCVWDVCQILKDLKWQKIRWFVLLAKQISNIAIHRFDDGKGEFSNLAAALEGSPSMFQNTSMVTGSKGTNGETCFGTSCGHTDDLAKLKFILIKISYRVDVLSAVGSFLV